MPRQLATLFFAFLLTGCATHVDRLGSRLGLAPPLSVQQIAPDVQAEMQRRHDAAVAALGRNDLEGAVAAWRAYAEAAPFQTPKTRDVRGYITLLEREIARRYARQAVTREHELAAQKGDRLHVALMPFQLMNDAPGEVRPFNRAIMAMVATDLSHAPGVKVLERGRIDALLSEIQFSQSGLVNTATAVRSGRLLGAGTVVVGVVYNGAPPDRVYTGEGKYTISTTLNDVQRGNLLGVQEAYGSQRDFMEMEKQIVHGILDLLGVKDRPAAVDRVHTRNWDAYAQFTLGLKYLAEDRFEQAQEAFAQALRFDPKFALAEAYHLDTPARALSVEQIRAEAGGG
ncbi:MAG: hypothetical protein HZB71_00070 [Betaproteobacteria bacterium]|nr:hypothetical protein [Betaproteobacteria bacterium]